MRLTKIDRYGHFYTNKAYCRNIWSLDGKKLEGEFFENQTLAIDGDAIDKLGQLEDIEDELGIDLITLFKALKTKVFDKQDNRYSICSLDGQSLTLSVGYKHFVKLNDYGKTWALTKEEIEKKY